MAKAGNQRSAQQVHSTGRPPLPAASPPAPAIKSDRRGVPGPLVLGLFFFTLFYLGLWQWVEVRLIYHGGGEIRDFPVFHWGLDLLGESTRVPGGIAQYAGALLAQSLFLSWWGALVLTLQAALIFLAAKSILGAAGMARAAWPAYLLPLILLGLYARYQHASTSVTSLAMALGLLWVWVSLPRVGPGGRLALLVGFCGVVFAVAAGSLLLFALLVALVEHFRRGSGWLSWVALPLAVLVACLAGRLLFGFGASESLGALWPASFSSSLANQRGGGWLVALHLALPAALMVWAGGRAFAARRSAAARPVTGAGSAPAAPGRRRGRRVGGGWPWAAVGLLAASILVPGLARDTRLKTLLAVDYHAWHREWPQVLSAAGDHPTQLYVLCSVIQATCHTGSLTRTLPVVRTPGDLLLADQGQMGHWKKSDLMFDLGYANLALHHSIEAAEICGERPLLLQRIALLNLALGNPATARVYLQALTRVPFQGQWARARLAALATDPESSGDEEVRRLRALMPRTDSVALLSVNESLLMLLNVNRQNRMAFEYLMTHCLLARNLAVFVKNLPRVADFPGLEIPPLWEEALAIAALRPGPPPDLPNHHLDPGAQQRLQTVLATIRACGGNRGLARTKLPAYYDRSYLFYYFFQGP